MSPERRETAAGTLRDLIRSSPVRVMPERYAVAKCARAPVGSGFFMVAQDADEVTVIAQEPALSALHPLAVTSGYRLIEIRVAAPFTGVGFLATVSRVLADAGANILVVSTYSKDYVLLEEDAVATALGALAAAGFTVSDAP